MIHIGGSREFASQGQPRFYDGFVLALAEGKNEVAAMRFGSAVAGLKCSRLGGGAGMPTRAEVEAYLAKMGAAATA